MNIEMNRTAAKNPISARFAAAAHTYHEESSIQRTAAEELVASIPSGGFDRILEVGCGTGYLTELLTMSFPRALIDAVDIARPMIDLARERMGDRGCIRWHAADARHFGPDREYPLIVSSSALHWMTPIPETVNRLAGMLQPGGCFAAALMIRGTLGELHDARQCLFPEKTASVCLPSAEGFLEAVASAGLRTEACRQQVLQKQYCSARSFLLSLNRQGVTGAAGGGGKLLNRTELRKLLAYYDREFAAPGGGVIATYRILYITARRQK
jgi:malonyl-CoA O-methyltransferase